MLLFWGFFVQIAVYAAIVATLAFFINWLVFKAMGRKWGEEDKYLK